MAAPPPTHLVVLCCHGIWLGGPSKGLDESEWLIADFQHGETPTFVEHVRTALGVLETDAEALLVISGGPTREETRLSEAASYRDLALANALFGGPPSLASRIVLEERALDSYHNILRSLVAFWRHAHYAWPLRVTVVSHGFKRARIVDGHCVGAIGLPASLIAYVGIDPPGMAVPAEGGEVVKASAMAGEQRAVDEWRRDPHGVGAGLAGKRARRNVWGVGQALFETEEERALSGLITRRVDGGEEVLDEHAPRPWAAGE